MLNHSPLLKIITNLRYVLIEAAQNQHYGNDTLSQPIQNQGRLGIKLRQKEEQFWYKTKTKKKSRPKP